MMLMSRHYNVDRAYSPGDHKCFMLNIILPLFPQYLISFCTKDPSKYGQVTHLNFYSKMLRKFPAHGKMVKRSCCLFGDPARAARGGRCKDSTPKFLLSERLSANAFMTGIFTKLNIWDMHGMTRSGNCVQSITHHAYVLDDVTIGNQLHDFTEKLLMQHIQI